MIAGSPKKFFALLIAGFVFPFFSHAATLSPSSAASCDLISYAVEVGQDADTAILDIFDTTNGQLVAQDGGWNNPLIYNGYICGTCSSSGCGSYFAGLADGSSLPPGNYALVQAFYGGVCDSAPVTYAECIAAPEMISNLPFTIGSGGGSPAAGSITIPPGAASGIAQNLTGQLSDPGTIDLLAMIAAILLVFFIMSVLIRTVPHDKAIERAKAVSGHTRKLLDRL